MRNNRKATPDLYSYTVRYDDGAAPNPFHGLCTLAICKPALRSTAAPGDWVAGIGSAANGDDFRLVYAMEVDEVVEWSAYDGRAASEWPHRLPVASSPDLCLRLGDCLYDHVNTRADGAPTQRLGVHDEGNRLADLRSPVLVARRFLYFGASAINLPSRELYELRHPQQGHRRGLNARLLPAFVAWYEEQERIYGNGQHGWPRLDGQRQWNTGQHCAVTYCRDAADDDAADGEAGAP